MITAASAREMGTSALIWAKQDLLEVIAIQEETVRTGGYADEEARRACPKLGAYWDELHAVLGELKRRYPTGPRLAEVA